jgi:hypothetical protein
MNFEEAVRAIEALEGMQVSAEAWGLDDDSSFTIRLDGILERGRPDEPPLEAPEVREALEGAIQAVTFWLEDSSAHISLRPDRFVRANKIPNAHGVEVVTRDGIIRVYRNIPWID